MEASLALRLKTDGFGLSRARKAINRLLLPEPSFALHKINSPQRPRLEAYIAEQFERSYGATITQYLPELFSMQCQGRFSAAADITAAKILQAIETGSKEAYLGFPESLFGRRNGAWPGLIDTATRAQNRVARRFAGS